MNFRPVFGVNTQVVFTPPAFVNTNAIAEFAALHDCWVQIRGSGSQSSIRVAGPLDKVEHVYQNFKQFEQSCFDGRCDKGFCDPHECTYVSTAPSEVPMLNMSGMPL
jgi:hypothetical protein